MSKSTLENNTSHHIAIFIIICSSRTKKKTKYVAALCTLYQLQLYLYFKNLLLFSEAFTFDIHFVRNQIHFDCICRTERQRKNKKRKMFQWMVFTRSKGSVFVSFLSAFLLISNAREKKINMDMAAQYKWSNGRMNKTAKKRRKSGGK